MSWSHVQGTGGTGAGGSQTTFMLSLSSPATAGNLVIVGANFYNGQLHSVAISDSLGNSWGTPVVQNVGTTNKLYVWSSTLTTGGTLTVTFVASGGTVIPSVSVDEYRIDNVLTSAGSSETNAATTTSITSPTIAITGANLVYGLVGGDGNQYTFSPANSATARYANTGYSGQATAMQTQDQLNVTATPASAGATSSASHNLGAICLVFREIPIRPAPWTIAYDRTESRRVMWAE